MRVETLCDILNADFYTGVPDSQLQALCNYLCDEYGISDRHIIAANEGNCTALAAGHFMATGNVPVVYMQNSGIGNIINPCASLLNDKVYGIPCIFVVGWRGEPGVHDEPQHVFQGEVTMKLLEDMDIATFVLTKETEEEELRQAVTDFHTRFSAGKSAAIVVKKGALEYKQKTPYSNPYTLNREEVIRKITTVTGTDPVICTTGKPGRELFEIREADGAHHEYDFLTVGSMGHCSSIALEIALSKPEKKYGVLTVTVPVSCIWARWPLSDQMRRPISYTLF